MKIPVLLAHVGCNHNELCRGVLLFIRSVLPSCGETINNNSQKDLVLLLFLAGVSPSQSDKLTVRRHDTPRRSFDCEEGFRYHI
jgi:hypothetical protein